jgi:hypothetical protein
MLAALQLRLREPDQHPDPGRLKLPKPNFSNANRTKQISKYTLGTKISKSYLKIYVGQHQHADLNSDENRLYWQHLFVLFYTVVIVISDQ